MAERTATYDVAWYMQYEATSKEDAALQAFTEMRDPESIVTIFNVSEPDDEVEQSSTAIDCQGGKPVRI